MQTDSKPSKALVLILVAALGWASLGPLILLLSTTMSPLAISGIRGIWIASAFAALCRFRRQQIVFSPVVMFAGIAYGMSALTYIWSLRLLPVAVAAPLHYTSPVILIIGSCIASSRRPTRRNCVGIFLSISGTAILIGQESFSSLLGIALAIASAGFWALYLVLQGGISEDDRMTAAMVGGAALALIGVFAIGADVLTPRAILVFVLIGVCSSGLPLLLVARASKVVPGAVTSLILLTEPAFAAILAFIINKQTASPPVMAGLAILVCGAASGIVGRTQGERIDRETLSPEPISPPEKIPLLSLNQQSGVL